VNKTRRVSNKPSAKAARFRRWPLPTDLDVFEVASALSHDERPVALVGVWAGGGAIVTAQPLGRVGVDEDPFAALAHLPIVAETGEPGVGGGWFGYLGYQLGRRLEHTGDPVGELPANSDFDLAFYDNVVRYDADGQQWWFECLWTEPRSLALERRYRELVARLSYQPAPLPPGAAGCFRTIGGDGAHLERVETAIEHIHAGDVFQVNLSMQLEASWTGSTASAFLAAVARLRPPYAAYLGQSHASSVVSLSPELYLRRSARGVESRPIKGTCARAEDPVLADEQRRRLLTSDKNRAENVMIVDLVRNDLGRVCRPGTVNVPDLAYAEPHPGVWHLVSRVRGELEPAATDADLLRASFPPGSITGAPKIRSMQLINQLEASPRIVYTGAIGYASPLAGLELNVAIRTFEIRDGMVRLGVGGGIVSDSDPHAELEECYQKAAPLITALNGRLEVAAG
jgi:para-aminobenzoate synthetase/4-amino-4-deoxychorismate lyase